MTHDIPAAAVDLAEVVSIGNRRIRGGVDERAHLIADDGDPVHAWLRDRLRRIATAIRTEQATKG